MRTAFGRAIVASFFTLMGCHPGGIEPEATGESKDAIQGGQVDTADLFAVGIIDRQTLVLCSGALIAPNLVLTARHCVSEIADKTVHCATDTFGKNRDPRTLYVTTDTRIQSSESSSSSPATSYRGKRLFVPDNAKFCGNDIALLELDTNVPDSVPLVTPAIEYPLSEARRYGRSIAAIGYGATSPAGKGTGIRRIRENIAITCIPGDSKISCPKDDQLRPSEFVAGDGTCQGDSGSSAYEQRSYDGDKALALGVLSRGGQDKDADICVGAIYTRVDYFRDLIVDAAIEVATDGDYSPPSWVNTSPLKLPDAGPYNPNAGGSSKSGSGDANDGKDRDDGCGAAPREPADALGWLAGLALVVTVGRRRSCRRRR